MVRHKDFLVDLVDATNPVSTVVRNKDLLVDATNLFSTVVLLNDLLVDLTKLVVRHPRVFTQSKQMTASYILYLDKT